MYTYYSDGTFRNEDNSWMVRFVTEENGHDYLFELGYGGISGLTSIGNANYFLERLEENNISDELAQLWTERGNNLYFIINERYTSQFYLVLPFGAFPYIEEAPGYVAGAYRIVDESSAEFYLQIPGGGSRSGADITFFEEDGVELLKYGDYLYIGYENLTDIYNEDSICTIAENGYAKWYNIGEMAGKTVTISVPEQGAYYVYDANGTVVSSSLLWGDSSVTLPEGGWIAFAGEAGAQFSVTVDK